MIDLEEIISKLDKSKGVLDPVNLRILSPLSKDIREKIAYECKMMVLYLGEEVQQIQKAEETAALAALPKGRSLIDLNVINVGAGNRLINQSFIAVDAFRENSIGLTGTHHEYSSSSILGLLNDLPFKKNSLDAIIAIHTLEHVENPIATIKDWLELLKPGGGYRTYTS